MPFTDGPYITAACICENTLEEKTGVLSVIRIIDTVTRTAGGPNPPENMEPFDYRFVLLLMLKSGKAQGRHEIKLIPELPSGETERPLVFTAHLEGEEKGHNQVLSLAFNFKYEGLYWFNIYFDGEKLTAIPLRVKYTRITLGG